MHSQCNSWRNFTRDTVIQSLICQQLLLSPQYNISFPSENFWNDFPFRHSTTVHHQWAEKVMSDIIKAINLTNPTKKLLEIVSKVSFSLTEFVGNSL